MTFRMIFTKRRPGGRLETLYRWCSKEELVSAFYAALAEGYASYSIRGSR